MNFLKTSLCAAAMLAISATTAFPQSYVSRASFTLPYAARWNSVLLQPGEYELSIPSATSWPQTIRVARNGDTINLIPAVETGLEMSNVSELRLEKVGGTAVITDLNLGAAGKSFHFAASKTARRELTASGERPSTKTVALISAAK